MIRVTVNNRGVQAIPLSPVTVGAEGIVAAFLFSDDWAGLAKTAIFKGSGEEVEKIVLNNECTVPPEVLAEAGGMLQVGVYGNDGHGTTIRPTIWGVVGRIEDGAISEDAGQTGTTPSWAAQLQNAVQEASTTANNAVIAAEENADDSEAWAVGTRDGEAIPETDPAYQNYAKYWAERAAASATEGAESAATASGKANEAAASAGTASNKAGEAATSAGNAAASAEAANTAKTAAQNAQTAAEQAKAGVETARDASSSSASQAAESATQAAGSASDAAQSATAAQGSESAAATSAQNAAASEAAAATSARNAGNSASAAATSETNAANSATAAAGSAGNAATSEQNASASATAAANSVTAAQTAQSAAEDAQGAAETAAASVSSSAAQIAQNTSDISELNRQLSDVEENQIPELKSAISAETRNLVFDKIVGAQIESNGLVSVNASYDVFVAPVTNGVDYALTTSDTPYAVYAFFTDVPAIGSSAYGNIRYVTNTDYITAPVTGYIAVRCATGFEYAQIEEGTERTEYIPHITATDFEAREKLDGIEDDVTALNNYVVDTINLIDPSQLTNGYIASNIGVITESDVYYTTDFIPVVAGQKITISPNCRKFLAYDASQIAISNSYQTNGFTTPYTYTATENGFVRVSYAIGNKEQAEYSAVATDYVPFGKELSDTFVLNAPQKEQVKEIAQKVSPILYGKKIVFCGDSFTQGDFSGLTPNEYVFPSGKYAGQNMVYPFFIGLSSGAEIVNEAISGSTMAYVDGNRNEFSTPNGRYTKIAADADYIVLYFGINDSHQMVPIGDIDDDTNTTFYGAWNIVMQYLIVNHKDAKIGIIISNGCDRVDYPNAEIAIAKKYGVGYLDINGDYKVPIVFRVNGKPDIDASILSARLTYYAVKPTGDSPNYHPNVKMHKYEATIFQKWLEGI